MLEPELNSPANADAPASSESPPPEPKQPPSLLSLADRPDITWDDIRAGIQAVALDRGHYHGYPLPDDNCRLIVSKRFPLQNMYGCKLGDDDEEDEDEQAEEKEEEKLYLDRDMIDKFNEVARQLGAAQFVNSWFDRRTQFEICLWRTADGKTHVTKQPKSSGCRVEFLLRTMGVSPVWDVTAETNALRKLQELIPEPMFNYYVLTGMFIERSKRSGVLYMFRRCRPTLALSDKPVRGTRHLRPLCALCLHPVGYYEGSHAGAMVPTDDVIAHLTLMRGDEHHYWKCATQHPLWVPEAGL